MRKNLLEEEEGTASALVRVGPRGIPVGPRGIPVGSLTFLQLVTLTPSCRWQSSLSCLDTCTYDTPSHLPSITCCADRAFLPVHRL